MAQRILITRRGGPEVLRLEDYEPAAPGPGEVRLRNQAVGVAFADVLMREGFYPPYKPPHVPGYEVVGRIAALGPGVTGCEVGDYVAALTVIGGYASEVIVPAVDLVPVPSSLAPEMAAALVLNGLTAWQMLERCCPARIGSIAIFGAAGGVGLLMLDLARRRGLTAYGIASLPKHAPIAARGAIALDRADPLAALKALAPAGVDAVFDGVGGRTSRLAFRMLAEGGTLVLFGAQGMMAHGRRNLPQALREALRMPWWSALSLIGADRGVVGYRVDARKRAHPSQYRADLAAVFGLAAEGLLVPHIDRVFDLAEAPAAHERMNAGGHTGKIVLRIRD